MAETGSTTLALFRGRVGLTEEGTGSSHFDVPHGGMGSTDGKRSTLHLREMGQVKQIDHFGVTLLMKSGADR
jgi:hypothetical protein